METVNTVLSELPGIQKVFLFKDKLTEMILDKTKRIEKIDTGLVLYKKHLGNIGADGKVVPPPKSKFGFGPSAPAPSCWKIKDKLTSKKSGYYWV